MDVCTLNVHNYTAQNVNATLILHTHSHSLPSLLSRHGLSGPAVVDHGQVGL